MPAEPPIRSMTPESYCKQRAAESGSSFYYSFRFLSPGKRRALNALYAFCREIDDIVDEVAEPGDAQAALDRWRAEVRRIFHGTPTHPIAIALQPAAVEFAMAEELFLELIDGMEMDLAETSYNNFSELRLYCYRVASVVGLLTVEIFGYDDRRTLRYAHDLGLAFQLTNILRDVGEDADRGRVYLPADELERFGVSAEQLRSHAATPESMALFRFQAERAAHYYDKALAQLPESDRYHQLPGLIMAAIYRELLAEIVRQDYPVLERRVTLSPWRKLQIALTTAWREFRRHRSVR